MLWKLTIDSWDVIDLYDLMTEIGIEHGVRKRCGFVQKMVMSAIVHQDLQKKKSEDVGSVQREMYFCCKVCRKKRSSSICGHMQILLLWSHMGES